MRKRFEVKKYIAISLFTVFCLKTMGQGEAENKHRIPFLLSHARISTLAAQGKKLTALPSFRLNYDYWINEKFAIGRHNEFIAETFLIERLDGEAELKRELPRAAIAVGIYTFEDGLSPIFGGGFEFEKNETLPVLHTDSSMEENSPKFMKS